jgi:Amt family ammonium transporter
MLFLGLAATSRVNTAVTSSGLLYGGGLAQLGRQALGVVAVGAYAFAATWLVARAVHRVVGMRVSEEEEQLGLDQALHAEQAYDFGSVRSLGRR